GPAEGIARRGALAARFGVPEDRLLDSAGATVVKEARLRIDRLREAEAPQGRRAPFGRARVALAQAVGEARATLHPVAASAVPARLSRRGLAAHLGASPHGVQ